MIKTWKHKGLKTFFETGKTTGVQAAHAGNIRLLLFQLANAVQPEDMNTPGNGFHKLKGKKKSYYSVKVSGNWRIIFKFDNQDAVDVELIDYH